MRRFGLILILLGGFGFFHFSQSHEGVQPTDPGTSITREMSSPEGRAELFRYASAGAAFVGILLLLFPQGR